MPFPHAVFAIIECRVGEPDINNRQNDEDASGSDEATALATIAANINGDGDLLITSVTRNYTYFYSPVLY